MLTISHTETWAARERDEPDRRHPAWRERNVVYRFEDGWTIERVTHRDDLFQESRLMRNCAGIVQPHIECEL